MRTAVIDCFSGIGGLSYGFKTEGFHVVAGIDLDATCKYAYEKNVDAPFLCEDIAAVSANSVKKLFGSPKETYRILIGCAPCTPFSIYVGRYKKNHRNDERWHLLREFARIALASKPDVISMENVPRLARHKVFRDFVEGLKASGYHVTHQVVRAQNYGVPQRRSRLVLIASLHGDVQLLPATHQVPITVREAIGDLPKIKVGIAHPSDRLHVTRNLTPTNMRRIRATREGGSWKDWNDELLLECHKKKRGQSFRSVYGRMQWDQPAPVITTQCLGIGNGRFGHPEQDRAISIREAAILQSFPRRYKLVRPGDKVNGLVLARQIGNAVPVRLARAIARTIRKHLEQLYCSIGIEQKRRRVRRHHKRRVYSDGADNIADIQKR